MKYLHDFFFFLIGAHLCLHLDDGAGGGGGGAAGTGTGDAGAAGADKGAAGGGAAGGDKGAAASGAGGAAAPAAGAHLGAFIDDKGAFKAGWTKPYGLPDTLEAKFTSPEALLKSHVALERMLGNQNKVAVPGPTATPEERAAFYKAIGRPDKAEDYGISKAPEKLGDKPFPKELWDQPRADGFTKLAHELGLTKEQASKLAEFDMTTGQARFEKFNEVTAKSLADAKASLKTEWGADYDANLALANKAAASIGLVGSEHPELANNPAFIKAMAKVGAQLGEDRAAGARGTSHAAQDPKAEIAAIRGDKNHPYHIKGHPQHAAAVATMQKLYAQAHPEPAR